MAVKKRVHWKPEERKNYILSEGLKLAAMIGVENVNPKNLSAFCSVQTSKVTIRHYFKKVDDLKTAISALMPN